MSVRSIGNVFGIFGLCLVSGLAQAQVNTEKLRTENPEGGFSGFVSSSVALRQGNTNRLRVDGGFRLQHESLQDVAVSETSTLTKKATNDLFFIVGELTFAEKETASGTDVYINKSFTHARWTKMWLANIGTEVFSQVQYNQSIRLQLRALGGLGVRWAAVESHFADLYLGTGYMFEHEVLDIDPPNDVTSSHRLTNYASLSVKLFEEKLNLINTAYAQPRVDQFDDYRIISESILNIKAMENLSVGITLNLRYDSDPPAEVSEKLDVELKNSIKITF